MKNSIINFKICAKTDSKRLYDFTLHFFPIRQNSSVLLKSMKIQEMLNFITETEANMVPIASKKTES